MVYARVLTPPPQDLLVLALTAGLSNIAHAKDPYLSQFNTESGGTFKTLGGYHVQRDNQQGSKKHFAGWLVMSGKAVSESEAPVPAGVLQH